VHGKTVLTRNCQNLLLGHYNREPAKVLAQSAVRSILTPKSNESLIFVVSPPPPRCPGLIIRNSDHELERSFDPDTGEVDLLNRMSDASPLLNMIFTRFFLCCSESFANNWI